MAREGIERRLTVILCADVVEYSRLMAVDEAGTFAQLKTLRKELIEPKTTEYNGHVIKLTGDGTLMEFASVVDTVNFAVDVQQVMMERNASVPEALRIRYRFGINLGEMIVDGEDIYGDGVNIAARLEGLAEPGGICISGKVYEEIRNKLSIAFEDMGEQEVKNIPEPVRVYRWTDATADPMPATAGAEEGLPLPDKPSIAVLPFTNMSGDPEQEYFSDGITEDIITELSRFPSLFVIARNSSFTFKGEAVDVSEVGRKLGVQFVVEGSVRKVGNRVRITAQLVEAETRNHLWAERYDRELEDIFAVQDEVVATIAATLPGRVEHARVEHSRRAPTNSLSAYDCILRGNKHIRNYRRHEIADARAAFERAVELDPNSARARAGVAHTYLQDIFWNDFDARHPCLEHAERAVALDRDEPDALYVLGSALIKNGRPDEGVRMLERALEIMPASADVVTTLGICLVHAGRHDEAIEALTAAIRLDPFQPVWTHEFLGEAYFFKHLFREAITEFERIVDPPSWIHAYLAASYANDGDDETAAEQAKAFVRSLSHEYGEQADVTHSMDIMIKDFGVYKRPEDRRLMIDGFRKAGLPV